MKKIITASLFVGFLFLNFSEAHAQTTTSGSVTSNAAPVITLTSPVSGMYKPGERVIVTWSSSNIPADGDIGVLLSIDPHATSVLNKFRGCIGGSWDDCMNAKTSGLRFLPSMYVSTKNTGSLVFNLPKTYLPSAKYHFTLEYYSLSNNTLTTFAGTGADSTNFFSIVSGGEKQPTAKNEVEQIKSTPVNKIEVAAPPVENKQSAVHQSVSPVPQKTTWKEKISIFFARLKFW